MKHAPKAQNDSLLQARAAMVRRGTSLARWSISNRYPPRSVIAAIRGERAGPKSREIVARLRGEGAL
jgi:lambda repressor-like predicted transcriptional regulator